MTIFSPFDIHRAAIMFFDQYRLTRQRLHFFISQGESGAQFGWHIFNLDLLAVLLAWCINHADFL